MNSERIEIVERVSAEWWHGVNKAGDEGRFPSELVDDSESQIEAKPDLDHGKGALELSAQVYAGRSKWDGAINMRSFETARDAMQLALRSASVSDDRIASCALYSSRLKRFVQPYMAMSVAEFEMGDKIKVYDFSSQIGKVETGDWWVDRLFFSLSFLSRSFVVSMLYKNLATYAHLSDHAL